MNIEKEYNIWADFYDTNENKTRDLDKKVTIKILSNYEFTSVLELGCGTGKNTEWLVTRSNKIIGLDFSQRMLDYAKQKIDSKKVAFKKADLNQEWDIQNNYADLITCNLTLEHINDLNFIFKQAYLKLKPGGKFFICELHPFKQYLGTKAKYETENLTKELKVYIHHISDYLDTAEQNKFNLVELNEWFDNNDNIEPPRLISFVFNKAT